MYVGYKILNFVIFYTANAPRRISCCKTHFPSDERISKKRSNFVKKKGKCILTTLKWIYNDRIYKYYTKTSVLI